MSGCRIRNFFKGQNVLVTGATGFLGKAIVEKLLRSCPEVQTIYVLMRPCDAQCSNIQNRLNKLLENSIFNTLKKKNENLLRKIHPVCGDIEKPFLGLSDQDQRLLTSTVSTVIHSAATTRFDEPLSKALEMNTAGPRRILEISKGMKNLKSLVHISTAYAHCDQNIVEEKLYSAPSGAGQAMILINTQKCIGSVSPELVKIVREVRPNTYTYSKALAENVIEREVKNLPVCIVRPSIITASLQEPVDGWIDNIIGPTGYFAGFGLGTFRVMATDPSKAVNFIPVDFTANLILCAAWETAMKKESMASADNHEITIYNCCSSHKNPLSFHQMCSNVVRNFREICPLSKALFYPHVIPTSNKFVYFVLDLVLQYIPAVLYDFLFPSTKFSAVALYNQLKRTISATKFFAFNEWRFENENVSRLYGKLTDEEKQTFCFDVDNINWTNYLRSYCQGIRKFIMKEEESTLAAAKIRMKKLQRISTWANAVAALVVGSSMVAMTTVIHF